VETLLQRLDKEKCSEKKQLLLTRQEIILIKSGQWEVESFGHQFHIWNSILGLIFGM
jgi:hypothetical protein